MTYSRTSVAVLLALLEDYWVTPRRFPPVRSEMGVAPALRDLGYL